MRGGEVTLLPGRTPGQVRLLSASQAAVLSTRSLGRTGRGVREDLDLRLPAKHPVILRAGEISLTVHRPIVFPLWLVQD